MAKKKKESGIQRINPETIKRVKKLLEMNNNKMYCKTITRFVDIAVIELLDRIEKNGNKIRWGQ